MFPARYRDLEPMLRDRGVRVDRTTSFRWIQACRPEVETLIRPHLRPSNGPWRVGVAHGKVKGRWRYLCRAIDGHGRTIDFVLSARRDAEAAKRFVRKALRRPHTAYLRTITVGENPAYPCAVTEMKDHGELRRRSTLRQAKVLDTIVEQDRGRTKRLVRPSLGFGSLRTERRTLAGYEAMVMVRKEQVRRVGGRDMRAQARLVAGLFEVAA
jgi:transposase-like protein